MFPNLVRGGAYVSTAKMGALRPMGQHKGAGLNLFCEFFGALAGGGTSASTSPNKKEECRDNCTVNNVFGIVIHPSKLCAPPRPRPAPGQARGPPWPPAVSGRPP